MYRMIHQACSPPFSFNNAVIQNLFLESLDRYAYSKTIFSFFVPLKVCSVAIQTFVFQMRTPIFLL